MSQCQKPCSPHNNLIKPCIPIRDKNSYFLFPLNLTNRKIINTTTAIEIITPTPMPVLNIPPITSHPDKVKRNAIIVAKKNV